MEDGDASALATRIADETGVAAVVGRSGDGACWVDVELPLLPGEARVRVTAHDPDAWLWLYETHVRPRLEAGTCT